MTTRKMWAIEYEGHICTTAWGDYPSQYPGDPPRSLLFCTRADARDWLREKIVCAGWVRVVRVTETVRLA